LNAAAFQLALRAAAALHCQIPSVTRWDRKQYYYPDLPKGYQISQYDQPLARNGYLAIDDPQGRFAAKRVGIIRAHLEEDAGKSMHDELLGKADSRIDLNRAGTPLLEIVSAPDMNSPLEARTYLSELKLLLTYLGVSDCNMQEGSLRVDANINLHVTTREGQVATPIVEVKNMNSFRAVERALAYEADRQFRQWQQSGHTLGEVPKQTRGWDDQQEITKAQRSKEESSDYRYFPDPDLAPAITTAEQIREIGGGLGELPAALRQRLQDQYQLSAYDADVLVNQGQKLVDFFLEVANDCGDPKQASNWIQRDLLRYLKEHGRNAPLPVTSGRLAELIRAVNAGRLDSTRAREVFAHMVEHQTGLVAGMAALGIREVGEDQVRELCRDLLAANPQIVEDVRQGKLKAISALIGQARQRNPNVNPNLVRETCLRLIEESAG
jgi:aspartyl-tRNA(Asn)/glutamyl-tRNA(Gln) amidotransferase subunit B